MFFLVIYSIYSMKTCPWIILILNRDRLSWEITTEFIYFLLVKASSAMLLLVYNLFISDDVTRFMRNNFLKITLTDKVLDATKKYTVWPYIMEYPSDHACCTIEHAYSKQFIMYHLNIFLYLFLHWKQLYRMIFSFEVVSITYLY